MSTDDHDLGRRIDAVSGAESTDDDLLTLAAPPESDLGELRSRIEEEHAEVQYLDSGPTRQHLEFEAVGTMLLPAGLDPEESRALEERAEEIGADVVVVPEDVERGGQFREAFGGVGAFPRFPIE